MKKKRILVIEDDSILLKAITTALTDSGYEALSALNGEDGLKEAESEKPDLILLDLLMPKKDGWETLSMLKGKTETKDIPVIILTVVGEKESKDECKEIGAEDYLVKSDYSLEKIIDMIKQVLIK